MKIRTDFVTNSSSSSFIIAVKSDLTVDEAKDVVEKYFKSEIDETVSQVDDEKEELRDEIKRGLVQTIINAKKYGMKLDDWMIHGGEASGEEYDYRSVLHNSGEFNSKKVKFKNVGC